MRSRAQCGGSVGSAAGTSVEGSGRWLRQGRPTLPALTPSTCATDAALARATDLVGAPDLTHAPLDDVMAECGVSTAAENLSRAPAGTEPQEVVDAWMESPGHRANILDPELTQVGVGCVEDGDAMLCSQIFLGPEA